MTPTIARQQSQAVSTSLPERRSFLFISYTFPPVGGAGVQRPAKFAKFMSRQGWAPVVLTASNPSVPTADDGLEFETRAAATVVRTRTLESGYATKHALTGGSSRGFSVARLLRSLAAGALQPDPQVLWLPSAVRAGVRLVRDRELEAVVVSGPPFSSFVIGALVSRWTGVPLLLDYRDEWTLSTKYWENRTAHEWADGFQQRLENWVLRSADVVIATTKMSARSLASRCKAARSGARVAHIYNGYDPDDFAGPCPPPTPGKFTLAYTGTLWNLTSIEPLVLAVEALLRDTPAAREKLEIIIAGRSTGSQQPLIDRLARSGITIRSLSYLRHHEAVRVMRAASALCVALSPVPGAERVVPAKIFEYIAAERPILAILPAGEACEILSRCRHAAWLRPDDVSGIATWLARGIAGRSPNVSSPLGGMEEFRRDAQARVLGALLDDAIRARQAR